MLTVSQLAKLCGLSRTTLLYYESIGLLSPACRSDSNYRRYSTEQLERLRTICAYRNAGLRLSDSASPRRKVERCHRGIEAAAAGT